MKQTNANAHLVQYRLRSVKSARKESEWLWRKGFVKEMSFKSGVKGRESDGWWERRWWLWWGDMCTV